MKIKTSELIGAQLDWAVAQVERPENFVLRDATGEIGCWVIGIAYNAADPESWLKSSYHPSTDWSLGGPLIEKYAVTVAPYSPNPKLWVAEPSPDVLGSESGSTPLIAAMRAIVSAKLGEEIEVPEELQS